MDNSHNMTTRSKSKSIEEQPPNQPDIDENDIDEHGNIPGLIDYNCEEEFDKKELEKELQLIKKNLSSKHKKNKKKRKQSKKKTSMGELLFSYILQQANERFTQQSPVNEDEYEDEYEDEQSIQINIKIESDNEDIELSYEEDLDIEEDIEEDEDDNDDDEEDDNEEESSDEDDYECDEYDDKYEELIDTFEDINSEDYDIDYFHKLEQDKKMDYIQQIEQVYDINENQIPLRFKVLSSKMEIKTKSIAISNLDKLKEMDMSTGEYSKMDTWINGLIKIPFGNYVTLPIQDNDTFDNKKTYIKDTLEILDRAIYGHKEAKTHILQVIGQWIRNPQSQGNVLALQGPMGNGKTTLVKEGIAKALNRPFAFITLGGASDSAFFDGHSYTYEGSHWGRIIQILQDSKCMNPIIYFDELDKISETHKGDEIIHMLTHLTDSSQNSLFQDNYFPGIDIDLSKVLFIFSFNDESKINKILKDRMYVINTKGFQLQDKITIANKYLLPELLSKFSFTKEDIKFTDDILTYIISNYTQKEEGVRNLKRCIETIISKINIYLLTHSETDNVSDKLSFIINNFKLPFLLQTNHIQDLLKINDNYTPPSHMYM